MILSRRALMEILGSLAGSTLATPLLAQSAPPQQKVTQQAEATVNPKFGYSDVVRKARDLGQAGFDNNPPALPEALAKLDSEAYRDIRFRPEKALLGMQGGPFRAQMVHLGPPHKQAVTVNIIRDGVPTPVPYSAALFDYGKTRFERPLPVNLGFGGFKTFYPLNDPRAQDEFLSFTAGNAFKVLGRNQRAGLSARGLVLGGMGTEPEEAPVFREFWIEQPASNTERLTVYAMLDSPSATAAYQFIVAPALESTLDVTVTLFPRKALSRIGIAPLSSMFASGENDHRLGGNFRPERHDSDGMMIQSASGNWLWRPLRNAAQQVTSSFPETSPRGFGLIQRDRNFDHFQDLERAYENRPNYWIEPRGDWGEGRIDLVERSASDAEHIPDNILAYWTPRQPLEAGQSQIWSYRIRATTNETRLHNLGRAINTFVTSPATAAATKRVIIDFSGNNLPYFFTAPDRVKLVATTSTGQIVQTALTPNPRAEGFRVTLDVALLAGQSSDLRVSLQVAGQAITETWVYPVQND